MIIDYESTNNAEGFSATYKKTRVRDPTGHTKALARQRDFILHTSAELSMAGSCQVGPNR